MTEPFPAGDTLCERCGYPLRDLPADATCPECGDAVAMSSPARRAGPPWAACTTPAAYLATARQIIFQPRRAYRHMSLRGSNAQPRLFLAINAGFVATLVAAAMCLAHGGPPSTGFAAAFTWLAGPAVLVLSYIEATGVAFFARRHGWRMDFHTAERLVCYNSVAMLPAAMIMTKIYLLHAQGTVASLLEQLPFAAAIYTPGHTLLLTMTLGLMVSLVYYDTLIFMGVRQIRFGHR